MQMKMKSKIGLIGRVPGKRFGQLLNASLRVKTTAIPLSSVGVPEEILFGAATQSADEAVVVSDVAGNIIFWDEGAERIFGYKEKDIAGKPMALLMPTKHSSRGTQFDHMLFNKASLSDGKIHELRGIRKDKSEFPVELSLLTWKFGGKPFFTTIMRDITDRKRMQRELLEISGREQQRIGQDLHDGLCQDLTAITLLTEILKRKLAKKSLVEEGADIEEITKLIAEAIVRTKFLSKGLLPVELEDRGLMATLQDLAHNTNELTNVYCTMSSANPVPVLDNIVAVHLYRIAQEAVNNAVKHAKAKHIKISLSKMNKEIILTVQDDGIGIKKEKKRKGLGLSIMYSRADTINASLHLKKGKNHGTTVTCSLRSTAATSPSKRIHYA